MAHHKSAIKRIRSAEKRHDKNRRNRSKLYTLTRAVRSAENRKGGEEALTRAVSFLDKMAAKGLIHENRAANQKSKLTRFVQGLK